jgi:capping protein beta
MWWARLTATGTLRAVYQVCTSGTWTMALQAVFCSRSVCLPHDNCLVNADTRPTAVNPTPKSSGCWDSIHVFDAQDRARTAHYKLTSTVILSLGTDSEALGGLDLSGNMVRQVEQDMAVDDDTSHVANIGKMVEDMELKMRNLLQEVYFGKAKDVVGDLRSIAPLSQTNRDRATQREMISSMAR